MNPSEKIVALALRGVQRRLDTLGVRAVADQLYYATCRALFPAPRGPRRPGYLLPRLIPRPTFDRVLAGSAAPVPDRLPILAGATDAPDLLDYGLPRVLICQHDAIAAALLANDLHMEASTMVLGASQLRAQLPEAVTQGAVHLLHDATTAGTTWRASIASATVHPGLHPGQARMLHLVRAPGGGAQLAAVPPEHLLRVLRRLLAGRPARWEPSLRQRADLGFLSWPDGGR